MDMRRDKTFSHVAVRGIAAVLPKERLDMESLKTEYGDKEIENIVKITGIHSLRNAPLEKRASDYCVEAAKRLIRSLEINFSDIDGLLFCSQSPDCQVPRTSALVQARLGIPSSAIAMDIHVGCTGYIYGLFEAMLLVESGYCKNVLLCVGDTISHIVRPEDLVLRMEIGDAGTATLVSSSSTPNQSVFSFLTKGQDAPLMMTDVFGGGTDRAAFCLHMDGMKIMRFVLQEIPPMLFSLLDCVGWKQDEIDLFAMHQPGQSVSQYLMKKLKLPMHKMPICINGYGNTGGASIPVLLCNLYADHSESLRRVVLCGFGAGLSGAAGVLSLEEAHICPLIDY